MTDTDTWCELVSMGQRLHILALVCEHTFQGMGLKVGVDHDDMFILGGIEEVVNSIKDSVDALIGGKPQEEAPNTELETERKGLQTGDLQQALSV